jgi:hypothetical protein
LLLQAVRQRQPWRQARPQRALGQWLLLLLLLLRVSVLLLLVRGGICNPWRRHT